VPVSFITNQIVVTKPKGLNSYYALLFVMMAKSNINLEKEQDFVSCISKDNHH